MRKSRIILPDSHGVTSLDIKRMEKELGKDKPKPEMDGYVPADAKAHAMKELRNTLKGFEQGTVSSMCLVVIYPTGPHSSMVAATVCCNDFEFAQLADITTLALEGREPGPGDPDEAG